MGIEMFLWQGEILYDNIQQISEYDLTLKEKKHYTIFVIEHLVS